MAQRNALYGWTPGSRESAVYTRAADNARLARSALIYPSPATLVRKPIGIIQRNYELKKIDGAQGRSRTADTAIFSRMLYQLSYLGPRRSAWRRRLERGYSEVAGPCPASFARFVRWNRLRTNAAGPRPRFRPPRWGLRSGR